jgi:hypothetical protein
MIEFGFDEESRTFVLYRSKLYEETYLVIDDIEILECPEKI